MYMKQLYPMKISNENETLLEGLKEVYLALFTVQINIVIIHY